MRGGESGADGVFADVFPFFGIVFAAPEAGVPEIGLPSPCGIGRVTRDMAFPEADPLVELGLDVAGSAKEMHMVRHQYIAPDKPSVGGLPRVEEQCVCGGRGYPRMPFLRADGEEHNRRLGKGNLDALSGMFSPDILHAGRIGNRRDMRNTGRVRLRPNRL